MPIKTQWWMAYPHSKRPRDQHLFFVSVEIPDISANDYSDLLRAGDTLELMETKKPLGKDPKTGRPFKDIGGWKGAVMEPQLNTHKGSHLFLVERPMGNWTVVKAGNSFSPDLAVHTRYIRVTQGLKTSKARLNVIMVRIKDALPKSKKCGWTSNALGDEIGDEDIVEALRDHGVDDVPGFGSNSTDIDDDAGFNPNFDGDCSGLDGYGADSQPEEEEEKAHPARESEGGRYLLLLSTFQDPATDVRESVSGGNQPKARPDYHFQRCILTGHCVDGTDEYKFINARQEDVDVIWAGATSQQRHMGKGRDCFLADNIKSYRMVPWSSIPLPEKCFISNC